MISRDGLALTNHHVVDRQRTLTALFPGGRERPVRVVRTNEEADIALIEIACEEDCWTVSLDDEDPAVGSDLLVIGTPVDRVTLAHDDPGHRQWTPPILWRNADPDGCGGEPR